MKKRSLVVAVAGLIFALAVPPARAGIGRWTSYGPPAGFLISLAVHPSGRLFLATELINVYASSVESGVYASDDGGRSWFWSGTGMMNERVRAVAVDPEDGNVYAVGMTRFFRSTDQGRTWNVRAQGLSLGEPVLGAGGDLLILVPGEPDTLFLARDKSLFRSPDDGATWQSIDFHPQTAIASILVDPNNGQSLFVGTVQEETNVVDEPIPGGLFHSADGGQTWSEIIKPEEVPFPGSHPPFSFGVLGLAATPASPGTFFALAGTDLFRSTDNGVTWQSVAPAPPPGIGYLYSVAVVPGSPDTVFSIQQVDSNDGYAHVGLYASQDSGTTWTRLDDGTIPPSVHLVVAPDGGLYGLTLDGFARGENGGAHWSHFWVGSGFCGSSATFPSGGLLRWSRDGSRIYSLVGSRLFESNDGGRSWTARSQSFSESCVQLTDVQIDPSRSEALFITTDAGVYRSDDSGMSWTATAPPGDPKAVRSFNTLAITQGVLIGGGLGIERSTDGGRTWQKTLSRYTLSPYGGQLSRYVTRLRVDPKRPQVVYAEVTKENERDPRANERVIYRSNNGGLTWRRLAAGATLVAVDPQMTRTLYLVRNGHLLRSLDDGRTWRAIGSLPEGATYDLLVDRADARTLYAASPAAVFRSTDGGVTWSPFDKGLRGLVRNLLRDPRRPVLYTGAGGLFQIRVP